jgi:hypothetical protein
VEVETDRVARMHDERTVLRTRRQHRVELSRFVIVRLLTGRADRPDRRTHRVGVRLEVEDEAAVRRAVPNHAVGVELHLEEPLWPKTSFGFGSVIAPPNQKVGPTSEAIALRSLALVDSPSELPS